MVVKVKQWLSKHVVIIGLKVWGFVPFPSVCYILVLRGISERPSIGIASCVKYYTHTHTLTHIQRSSWHTSEMVYGSFGVCLRVSSLGLLDVIHSLLYQLRQGQWVPGKEPRRGWGTQGVHWCKLWESSCCMCVCLSVCLRVALSVCTVHVV